MRFLIIISQKKTIYNIIFSNFAVYRWESDLPQDLPYAGSLGGVNGQHLSHQSSHSRVLHLTQPEVIRATHQLVKRGVTPLQVSSPKDRAASRARQLQEAHAQGEDIVGLGGQNG